MAFFLRRPFAVPSALRQAPKLSNTARFIHNSSIKPTQAAKPSGASSTIFAKSRQTFQNAFRRTYMQQSYNANTGSFTQKLLYGGAIVGGTILATNLVFNRETREDGGMPAYERSFLNETFMHTGLGIGKLALSFLILNDGFSMMTYLSGEV